jgi:hypothetical protein
MPIYLGRHAVRRVFQTSVRPVYERQSSSKNQCHSIHKNILHQAKHCRDISLNAIYLVILKTLEIEASSPVLHDKCTLIIA